MQDDETTMQEMKEVFHGDSVDSLALEANKKRYRGKSLKISPEIKSEIIRLVNEEKRPSKAVAREMGLPATSVLRIAGTARGDEKYLPKPNFRRKEKGAKEPEPVKLDIPMPPNPFEGSEPYSLKGKRLNSDEKDYLACLVNVQGICASRVSEMYSMVPRTVERYAAAARAGRVFRGPGKINASIVDAESDALLRAELAKEGDDRPSREMFLAMLQREAVLSNERKLQKKKRVRSDGEGEEQSAIIESAAQAEEPVGKGGRFRPQTYKKYMSFYGF